MQICNRPMDPSWGNSGNRRTAVWLPGSASWDPQNHGKLGSQGYTLRTWTPWNWQPKLMFGRTTRWKTNILNVKHRGLVKMNLLLAKNCIFSWAFSVSFRELYRWQCWGFYLAMTRNLQAFPQLGAATHFSSRKSGTNMGRIGEN